MEYTPAQIDARIQADPEMQALAKNDETEFLARHEQIYNEFGYNSDGSPMRAVMKGIHSISKKTGISKDVVQGIANVPIPLATTIAGTAAGALSPVPGGAVTGAVAGSILGEELNYAIGLRDKPGPVDIGFAAAAPLVGPLASRLKGPLSNIGQALPGAGKHMHNLAADAIAKHAKYMEVTDDMVSFMRQNFKSVPTFRTDVPLLKAHLKSELNEVTKSLAPDSSYIKKLNEVTKNLSGKNSISFEQLMATEKSFIDMGSDAPHQVWKKLSGVIVDDLEAQASNPKLTPQTRAKILTGVEAYKNFVAVNQRKQGQHAIESFVNKSVTQLDDGLVRFNKPAFLKALNSEGMQVFESSELEAMKKAVADLGYIGPAPKSMTSGAVHTGSYGAVGLGAYAVGGVPGVITAAAILGALRIGLSSETGRKAITYLAKKGHGTIPGAELHSMIGQITAGANAGGVAGVSGAGTQPPPGIQPFANQE